MANTKISDLNALLAANAADTDLIVLVKDPAGSPETVKMTVAEAKALFGGGASSYEGASYSPIDGSATPVPVTTLSGGDVAVADADVSELASFYGFIDADYSSIDTL